MSEFISMLNQIPWIFIGGSLVLGAIIGSFINVVIHRLPIMMKREWQQECSQYILENHTSWASKIDSKELTDNLDGYPKRYNLIAPGSACPGCHTQIKPWHNLPILGYLLLGGKCSSCQSPIAARYPIIEAISGIMIAYLAWHFGPSEKFVFASIFTFALIALTCIDIDEMLLPDQLTLPLLWLGLLVNLSGTFVSPMDAIIGAMAGYLSLWSVFWVFKLFTGKEGMGHGDFKLLAVLGAWLGWQMLPLIILFSSLIGAVVGILLILTSKMNKNSPIPFGPYIAMAGWIALLWGQDISNWYIASL